MLHIPDDIRELGPSWVYWCFVMEWFCGSLLPCIKSRSNPYPSMTKRVIESVQVSQIKKLYLDLKNILERPSKNASLNDLQDQEPTTAHETLYPECECWVCISFRSLANIYVLEVPHTVLCHPHHSNDIPDRELLAKLETHFKILFSNTERQLTVDDVRLYARAARMDQWGKVRRAFGGDGNGEEG